MKPSRPADRIVPAASRADRSGGGSAPDATGPGRVVTGG